MGIKHVIEAYHSIYREKPKKNCSDKCKEIDELKDTIQSLHEECAEWQGHMSRADGKNWKLRDEIEHLKAENKQLKDIIERWEK